MPSGSTCLPLPLSGGSVFCHYFVLCPPLHAVICVRLFIWVMSPTHPLESQVSGLRKAVSESHREVLGLEVGGRLGHFPWKQSTFIYG